MAVLRLKPLSKKTHKNLPENLRSDETNIEQIYAGYLSRIAKSDGTSVFRCR